MTSLRKAAVAGLATCSASLLVAPASASAMRVGVGLPKPGTTTVAVSQIRYRGKLPRHAKVRLRNRSRLPSSDRGLYAIFGRQRGRRAILTAYTIILRKEPPVAAPRPLPATASYDLTPKQKWDEFQFAILAHVLAGEKLAYGETAQELAFTMLMSAKMPTEPPPKLEDILKAGGVETNSPGLEGGNPFGKSLIDTGHYDDGHSFGWNSAGTRRAIADWTHLTGRGDPYGKVIETLEVDLTADLNGDGTIGETDSGPGTSVGTEAGPPTIMRAP